jgi:hypothetical protein
MGMYPTPPNSGGWQVLLEAALVAYSGYSLARIAFEELGGEALAEALTERESVSLDFFVQTRLEAYAARAVAQLESGELQLSEAQALAGAEDANLAAAYRGQVLDRAVKSAAAADPELEFIYITRSGEFGPDFYNLNTGQWYDLTTLGQWSAHMSKYAPSFGSNGVPILH